ncbi:MAG: hypothetical protein UX08_C0013G0008 [Candidatus Collierbacteria bacterium GW2011_GWB1_45_35]|uniref:Addiction module toxin, RelE/StbE family n=1 Tax=Candidatus Collierbacteria bacterium GW2011_GWB2_45_17 TaxID=1618388 RepID=A0A837IPE4_9BACT|nr:MAG: hypothetical protein UW48_C0008G0008 [Microgenomates group bacterium GW2011_GWC1_44_23]KKT95341.1 MAG: hypothetical protein UW96_C0008G0008 [Candidatus Collierbacteria bacterium GW2011_GWA1_45_15]KKT99609.1 MAG: hypothetical protein UX01_C0009G0039 [Candidatus Collierbacteria bacterium GW2011_GWB2_45_17]KKU04918.1 MAG: hypothetical protein UX08_C0013G0008 [Candidatus Collierbacteria bacterium GW2011_GWB1_45_35]KKU06994.1 MAG: hypothetical protein UX11_C0022G0027 [Candidatus Collierbacte
MNIIYTPEAFKNLKKIGAKDLPKIKRKINTLHNNPLVGKLLQGKFEGLRCLRAWPLRIIYTFDSNSKIITIETVDYRGDVYK